RELTHRVRNGAAAPFAAVGGRDEGGRKASFVVHRSGLYPLPAWERELERRRAARAALELERSADHADAPADAHEPEPATLSGLGERALDLEAHAVVDDLQLDGAPACPHTHRDVGRPGVLADVRERLLDRAEDRDALSGRERVGVAPDLELGVNAGALRERVDLPVQDLAQRSAEHALRLERMCDLAQLPIELDETRREVVETSVRLLAELLEDERIHLLLEELHVGREREHVLDRPVVQVEAKTHEAAFG